MTRHLAIFVGDAIEKIFRGEKVVEGRFSENRNVPFGQVARADEIYLKQSGGPIVGQVTVDNVLYFEGLDGAIIGKLRREYGREMAVDDQFWRAKGKARFATLIFLRRARRFVVPLALKKRDRRSWLILSE